MFAPGLFPPPLFPPSLFPRPVPAGPSAPSTPFDLALLAYLEAGLDPLPVWIHHVPQGKPLPAASFFGLDEDPYHSLFGAVGLTGRTYQVDLWSLDAVEVQTVELAARNLVRGFRGYMGTTYVSSGRIRNRVSQYEASPNGTDQGTWHIWFEVRFLFRDPAPTF